MINTLSQYIQNPFHHNMWSSITEPTWALCERIKCAATSALSKFSLGATTFPIRLGAAVTVNRILDAAKVIDTKKAMSLESTLVNHLAQGNPEAINAIAQAKCKMSALAGYLSKAERTLVTPGQLRQQLLTKACLFAPLLEELALRLVIQEFLLRRVPKAILRCFSPDKARFVDSLTGRVVRILSSATLFSLVHLVGLASMDSHYLTVQITQNLAAGILLGVLQESRLGFLGALGLHACTNLVVSLPMLTAC